MWSWIWLTMRFSSLRKSPISATLPTRARSSAACGCPPVSAPVMSFTPLNWTEAINAVEVERRGADVLGFFRLVDAVEARGHVEGNVVIDELPEEDEAHRYGGRGRAHRPSIHRSALGAEAFERAGIGEEWRQVGEDAAEPVPGMVMMIAVAIGVQTGKLALSMSSRHREILS